MGNRLRSFSHAAHSAFIFDTSKVELGYVARCTVGVAVPLLVALALGYPAFGLAAAIGALSVGFASQQGVYRTRAAAMLWTAAGMAISTAAGSLAAPNPIAIALVAVAWGFAYGTLVALGPAATLVGLNSCVALALASAYSFDAQQIAIQSLLVLAGGLVQTLLLVAIWPMRRYGIERGALRDAYAVLAAYARAISSSEHALPDASVFQSVRTALADPQPFARRRDLVAFSVLQDEAERIRAALAALTADHYYWEQQGERAMCAAIEQVGDTSALVLESIAKALANASEPQAQDGLWEDARHAVDTVNARPGARHAFTQSQALLGQLRAAWRSAGFPAEAPAPDTPARLRPHADRWSDGWLAIRSNLNLRSPVGRHAVRVALALGLAMLFAQHLPAARGYWIPLTVVLILKPDFTATFARGFARIAGTLIGAVFITAL
ncbi:MAG: FUSC family protein, partial [Vulcanimicrobiaceae bacterium]